MAQAPTVQQLVKVLKALAEPSRLRILRLLASRSLYVCELEAVLNMNQPRVSQHLRVLKEAGLVSETKEAQRTRYSLELPALLESFKDLQLLFSARIEDLPEFAAQVRVLDRIDSMGTIARCGAQAQGRGDGRRRSDAPGVTQVQA